MKYAIADQFSDAARREAAGSGYSSMNGRTKCGECPLGVALRVDGKTAPAAPPAYLVAAALSDGYIEELCDQALDFTADWDNGEISDLYAALGITRDGQA